MHERRLRDWKMMEHACRACFAPRMKRIVLLFVACAGIASAEPKFWERLTPEQREAAGLANLTPRQQAALDALAERYAEDTNEAAVRRARDRVRAEIQAEAKFKAEANAGLAVRTDDQPIKTRIAGVFRGWEKGTKFTLQNGQVWQVDGSTDNRFFPKRVDPEVELQPAGLFGWKLYVQPEGLWVRVKRVK